MFSAGKCSGKSRSDEEYISNDEVINIEHIHKNNPNLI